MGKTILLVHDAPLLEWKGTQRILLEYGNSLVERGYNVIYTSPKDFSRPIGENRIKYGIEVKFSIREMAMCHHAVYHISSKYLKAIDPDLVLISTFNAFPLLPFSSKKIVFGSTVYGPEHEQVSNIYNRIKILIKKEIFKLISLFYSTDNVSFFAINPDQIQWLKQMLPKKFKIYYQPPPIECGPLHLIERNKLPNSFTVLYLGELTAAKGFADFVKIVESFETDNFKNNLIFKIGTIGGPMLKEAKDLCARCKSVLIVNTEEEETKIHLYNSSSILVSPSSIENFHIVSAEAQLCGLPVISSDISGPRSIIQNNVTGMLIEPGNIGKFHDAILKYYNWWKNDINSYYEAMEANAKTAERFCKENVLPKFLDMIHNELGI